MTLESIFETLGGAAGLGRVIGVSTEHASAMRRRNSIPARYWANIVVALEGQGIALSALELAMLQGGSLDNSPTPPEASAA